ncbi:VanZ family protein [Kutzneria sp. CA-103260]|uniref:VanZ family protein n=1 Tax=Kutzneria sp. CA-103260 TaxID=2802641 RepID=UPI001BACF744|nr:VanZ family protein [Kutzneria sp. CA-103260]QUQ69407.1 VanZ like family protein [Kutzneria sp. CA-103260]
MVNAYLLPIRTAALLFPLLAMLLFVPTAIVLYRRHGVLTGWRGLSFASFLYYSLAAFCLVIVPLPSRQVDVCVKYADFRNPQLVPGNTFSDIWKEAKGSVSLNALVLHNPAVWETGFNLLLLLPLGMYLRYHFRRGFWTSAAIGLGVACFFEFTQLTGLWGIYPCPYRLFDVDDIIVNSLGCVLGWFLAGPVTRWLPTLDSIDVRALARVPVPFGRRMLALLLDAVGFFCCLPFAAGVWYLLGGQSLGSAFLVGLLVFVVWFVLAPWATGATVGKHILRLRLVDSDDKRPAPWRLLVREVLLAIAFVPLTFVAMLSVVVVAVSAARVAEAMQNLKLETLVGIIEERPSEVAFAAFAVLLSVAIPLGFLLFARLHNRHLGLHELASGVRNVALPPTKAAPPSTPEVLPEESQDTTPSVL